MFGEVLNDGIQLSDVGQIVNKWLVELIQKYKNIELDEYVIMPNHMHGIMVVFDVPCRGEVSSPMMGTNRLMMKGGVTPPLQKHTLGQIIAYFKYQTTKQINQIRGASKEGKVTLPLLWQRNYYEHVIRNEDDMNTIREYIINNPLRWGDDENNPVNIKVDGKGTLQHAPTG
jgi:REP element-mobilizing transposase RayT